MSARPWILLALLGLAGGAAVVLERSSDTVLQRADVRRLLEANGRESGAAAEAEPRPLWRILLATPFARATEDGLELALGRVLSFPTAARLSAESAGELLALEAEGPQGALGIPLWRAILTEAVRDEDGKRTLALYGCLHTSDPDGGPVLEDSYAARLALAAALERHAREAGEPVLLLGVQHPAKGGVNLQVQLLGPEQSVRVTYDGRADRFHRARRSFRPATPNDERARQELVAVLRELAEREGLGTLHLSGETSPAASGVDLRFERYDGRLAITIQRGASRFGAWIAEP